MSANLFTEALEPRMMLSGDPSKIALNATVRADHVQIHADLLKFKSDAFSNYAHMLSDVNAIKGDHLKDATTVTPLIAKFRSDLNAMRSQLNIDRLGQRQVELADESVIVGDLKQIAIDKGNPTLVSADRAKLLTDRIKLQTDLVAGLDARLATRQAAATTLGDDLAAIVTAAQSDPNATPKLIADLQKATTDKTNGLATLTADLQTLIADRTKLIADLTALQSV